MNASEGDLFLRLFSCWLFAVVMGYQTAFNLTSVLEKVSFLWLSSGRD